MALLGEYATVICAISWGVAAAPNLKRDAGGVLIVWSGAVSMGTPTASIRQMCHAH
jgi:hypothetical protein